MKRRFEAMRRQYEVKKASDHKNLWTNDRTWPYNGAEYDAATQTYTIPAGEVGIHHYIYTLPEPIPAGTPVSMMVFLDSGRLDGSDGAGLYVGGGNQNFSTFLCSVSFPFDTDLTGAVLKQSEVLTKDLTVFAISSPTARPATAVEPIRFRVMLVIGDTPPDTFTPYGVSNFYWADAVKSGFPSVKLLGKAVQAANPTPTAPQEVKINNATVKSVNADGTYLGGTATAPNLLAAVDGSCQSTYDSQTGELVNWWWDKITLDGSEEWRTYGSQTGVYHGFEAVAVLPERTTRAAYWCNQCLPDVKGNVRLNGTTNLWCGVNHNYLYALNTGFEDYSLDDWGLANWKAHLAEHPLEVWVARNEPEITNIGPQRLTCPTGHGQIVQETGDISDCPMEIKYLAHGGNAT